MGSSGPLFRSSSRFAASLPSEATGEPPGVPKVLPDHAGQAAKSRNAIQRERAIAARMQAPKPPSARGLSADVKATLAAMPNKTDAEKVSRALATEEAHEAAGVRFASSDGGFR